MGIIFDLDGTLFDSLEDLKNSLNTVLEKNNLKQHNSEQYRDFIGNGMQKLVERAIPKDYRDKDLILEQFLDEYGRRYYEASKPYEGINALLKALNKKGVKIAICTNKKQEYTDEIVKRFFPDIDFISVVGHRNDGLNKPSAHYPKLIAKEMGLKPNQVYFIGDSDVDMQTALNANMKPIGVAWGFRSTEELKEAGAIQIVKKAKDILKLV